MKSTDGCRGKKVTFEVAAESGSEVFVAGTFNDWDPKRHPMRSDPASGRYKATLVLPRGRHEYKFVINGEWCADVNSPEWVPNSQGSLNSVVAV